LPRDSKFSIDFRTGPLAVGADYVHETFTLERGDTKLRIRTATDCVRDRLSRFYHWNDFTALHAAVTVAICQKERVDMESIRTWSIREQNPEKFDEFRRRIG
jgi:hypothetical protein